MFGALSSGSKRKHTQAGILRGVFGLSLLCPLFSLHVHGRGPVPQPGPPAPTVLETSAGRFIPLRDGGRPPPPCPMYALPSLRAPALPDACATPAGGGDDSGKWGQSNRGDAQRWQWLVGCSMPPESECSTLKKCVPSPGPVRATGAGHPAVNSKRGSRRFYCHCLQGRGGSSN